MKEPWRPDGWKNPWYDSVDKRYSRHALFEAGADAMLDALFELAKDSPTKTFTLDSRPTNIYTGEG